MTVKEKLEFLYLAPYYLQATFFMIGTISWFLSEAVFKVHLPFWTQTFGWSLVFTNFLSLPLMNTVGLFLEESEEKDYLGIFSFILLSYIVIPFQGYAAVKGLLEKEEGPWFRTPKTGVITDVIGKVKLGFLLKKVFPWFGPIPATVPLNFSQSVLSTANNIFDNFSIPQKKVRWIGRTFLAILLITSTFLLSVSPSAPYIINPRPVMAFGVGGVDSGSKSGEIKKMAIKAKPSGVDSQLAKKTDDWGVLAINTNKSLYSPGEEARITITILDEKGMMVCDAKLNLEIRNSNSEIRKLSTGGGEIKVNPECEVHNVTLNPDYEVKYRVGEAGKYETVLTAETKNGTHSIRDSFEVRENLDFDVERNAPTRIYPPSWYPMSLMIAVNRDFLGRVEETVPLSFGAKCQNSNPKCRIESAGERKKLVWEVNWRKGEVHELSYDFKASDRSPQHYQIGPARFINSPGQTIFEEARQWQIAADVTFPQTSYLSNTASTKITATTSWQIITTANASSDVTTKASQKKTAGYTQWQPGAANTTNAQPKPTSPSGKGFIYDTGLASQISSGTWTFNLRTTNSSATGTGYATVCVWKVRLFGGVVSEWYPLIDCVDGSTNLQANTTTLYVSSVTVSNVSAISFKSDEYLYIEYWLHTTVAGTSATGNIVFETNTSNDSIVAPGASSAVVPSVSDLYQYNADHQTYIPVGGSTTDGISTNVYLDANVTSLEKGDTMTPKVEVRDTSTSFNNTATNTGDDVLYDSSIPDHIRSTCMVYDSGNQQLVMWGGYTGSSTMANTDNTWVMPIKANKRSQWKKLSPSGTPPQANRAHVCVYDDLNKRLVVYGGWNGTTYLTSAYFLSLPTDGSTPAWSHPTVSGTPPNSGQQLQACAIYDPTNDRMIIYGGYAGSTGIATTYQFTLPSAGTPTWTNLNLTGPTERNASTCVFDSDSQRMVLFGGQNVAASADYNEVWSLNLTSGSEAWTQLFPTGAAPAARAGSMGMIQQDYTGTTDRMIIFAGDTGTSSYIAQNDIWQLDLPESGTPFWTEKTPSVGKPHKRAYGSYSGVYDPNNNRALFIGGFDGTNYVQGDIYAFSLPTSGNFEYKNLVDLRYMYAKDGQGMIYASSIASVVNFGGSERGDNPSYAYHNSETWKMDLSLSSLYWRDIGADMAPINREGASFVYDSLNDRGVMCLGLNVFTPLDDCWALSLPANGRGQWSNLNPSGTAPSARWQAASIYDSGNNRMVFFAGDTAGTANSPVNTTFFLSLPSGSTPSWSQPTITGGPPAARWGAVAVYQPSRTRMIVFGGANKSDSSTTTYNNDVWELTLPTGGGGSTWTQLYPTGTAPAGRRNPVAVFDPDRGDGTARMVIYGGYSYSGGHYNDVWELTLPASGDGAWTQLSPTGQPPTPRRSASAAYDSVNDRMIVYGGRGTISSVNFFLNDTWALTLGVSPAWSNLDPDIRVPLSTAVSGLSLNTNYHWQAWALGSTSGTGSKSSFGNNLETETDFAVIPEKLLWLLGLGLVIPRLLRRRNSNSKSGSPAGEAGIRNSKQIRNSHFSFFQTLWRLGIWKIQKLFRI